MMTLWNDFVIIILPSLKYMYLSLSVTFFVFLNPEVLISGLCVPSSFTTHLHTSDVSTESC